jgi:hypothetical protein
MPTILILADPPLQVAMSLVFVSNPVCFSLERLWLFTLLVRAGKWLYILVNMLRPIRWLLKLLRLEAQLAFELRWKIPSWRHRDSLWESLIVKSAFPRIGIVVRIEVCYQLQRTLI